MTKEKEKRNIDIWLILVIVLMVLAIGGGLWLTGQSVLARLDVISTQTRSQVSRLEMEVFEMRKQLQSIEFKLRGQHGHATPAAAAPAAPAGDEPAKPKAPDKKK